MGQVHKIVDRLSAALSNASKPTQDDQREYAFEDSNETKVIDYPRKPINELYSIAESRASDILQCDLDIAELEQQKNECSDILLRCQTEINLRLQKIGMNANYKGKQTPPPVPEGE